MNFAHFPEMHARSDPGALAVADSRIRLDYRELDEAANRFAQHLVRSGIGEGDRAAIHLPNRAEFAICFLGALKAGIIAVPINWRLKTAEVAAVLDHCRPAILVSSAALAGSVPPDLAMPVLTVEEQARAGSFWEALAEVPASFASTGRQNADIANLLYTSGTTGTPKAVIHTHGMRASIAATMIDRFAMSRHDVGLGLSPMFHTGGLSVFGNAMFCGGAVFLMEKWDLDSFVEAVRRERVTYMHLISTVVVDIVRAPAKLFEGERTVRFTWGGGHSTDAELFREYERRLGGVYLQGYSRTEGGITYNLLDGEERRFRINGYPSRDNSEIAILEDDADRACPPGTVGEIAVRGDGVSPGYWNLGGEGAQPAGPQAWQRTGDIGHMGEDGALVFIGRRDHMIKTGGENVYPHEVLPVILDMPEVSDAVVFDMPHERLGQCVAALVVPKAQGLEVEAVDAACRAKLAGFKIPRRLAIVDELPRLGSQKVDLAACRELLRAREKVVAAE